MPRLRCLTILLLAGWLIGCAPVQKDVLTESASIRRAGPGLEDLIPMDPATITGRLENGLSYFIRANGEPKERAELWLAIDAGSIQEDDDQRGLAHFVEHMAFNGTKNFAKHELVDYLESIGMTFGPDLNAYTSFDETVYTLMIPTDDPQILDQAFLILEDWAHGISFDAEEIEKERGVVLEERRGGRGAGARMRDKQFPVLFQGSRYAERLPIGDEKILKTADRESIVRFYRDWYRPDLMAVIVVGDIDVGDIEQRIRERFGKLESPENPRPRTAAPVPDHDQTLYSAATDPEMPVTGLSVYHKLPKQSQGSIGDYRRSIIEGLHHSMFNDRLDEIRQQADPPFLFAAASTGSMVRSGDAYIQSVRVEGDKVQAGLEALLLEVRRVERHGFTATEFERAKKNLLRGYEQLYEERDKTRSSAFSSELLRHFLTDESVPGIEREVAMVRELLPAIGLDEVNGLARDWVTDRSRVILFNGPEKEGLEPPDEATILSVFESAGVRAVAPYVDRVRDEPLLSEVPKAGKIVEESRIDELNLTEWRLSNGVRVLLKPTDFKNDEIQLYGFSPGGTSLVEDARYPSARYATSLMSIGGLGDFDRIELEKALAGKAVSAGLSLRELEETAFASASPEDVETMFQLLYLRFTAPRKDPEAFSSWLTRRRSNLENRLTQPQAVFSDRFNEEYYGGHYRRLPPTLAGLDEIDLDVAFDVYNDRFSDAGDFTFIIVGNFDLDGLKPLVLSYLGGLPSKGREENWRDIGIKPAEGVKTFEVRQGIEPKSQMQLLFTTDAEWTRQAQQDLAALAAVLRIRLREILREDLGGTYGVQAQGSISRQPRQRSSFYVSFGCAPENLETLTRAVFDEIERIQKEGVDIEEIDKVKESMRRKREVALRENDFWTFVLANYYRYGEDPRPILAHDELVESVSSGRIQAAAQRYLSRERYVLGALYPEEP